MALICLWGQQAPHFPTPERSVAVEASSTGHAHCLGADVMAFPFKCKAVFGLPAQHPFSV